VIFCRPFGHFWPCCQWRCFSDPFSLFWSRRPAGPVGFSAVSFHFQKIKFTVGKCDFTSQFLSGQSKAVCESAKSAPSGAFFSFFAPGRAGVRAGWRLIVSSQFGLRHESSAALLKWRKPRSV
jgi:hypothetical protein